MVQLQNPVLTAVNSRRSSAGKIPGILILGLRPFFLRFQPIQADSMYMFQEVRVAT